MTLLNLAQAWTRSWAQQSQQHARRNAMIALTECTQRRAEREEVERYLAERGAARAARPAPREVTVSLHA
ncbi:hypothetical protein BJ993_000581 [Nocardioides aromaticivorans]|uniref:Uncharacterized protein n=1 Tax=Nocardioides aromaticivorans TaxID=200618 RepID=A0A7Z0CJB5_9ACTN|nr:hypothetical protein [Nocardioides aromaticivorans]NYI43501.1 hypothetical protein [Nocardioides aromaticivorans]QSR27478.1 hypothetical protein CFH99_17795 [Nocardioides aromaticivorans]